MVDKDRRSAVRVDDFLPFEYEILSKEQYEEELNNFFKTPSGLDKVEQKYPFFSWIQSRYKEIEEEIDIRDQIILDLLVSINEKLDSLMNVLIGDKHTDEKGLCFKKPSYINISGTGIRFTSSQQIKKDSFLKIRICIPLFPSFIITALGKVIWTKKEEHNYKLGVEFTAIHEEDKEILIHYIFIKQRRLIRKSKKN